MNQNIKNIVMVVGVVILFTIAGLLIKNDSSPTINVSPNIEIPAQLGAVSGPDIYSPYLNINGIETWNTNKAINNASTTICSIKSPAATSTLAYASLDIKTSTTTALYLEMAQATNDTATTTRIGDIYRLAAGAKLTVIASTTPSYPGASTVFAPNTWFNIKYWETTNTDYYNNRLGGTCQTSFITTTK